MTHLEKYVTIPIICYSSAAYLLHKPMHMFARTHALCKLAQAKATTLHVGLPQSRYRDLLTIIGRRMTTNAQIFAFSDPISRSFFDKWAIAVCKNSCQKTIQITTHRLSLLVTADLKRLHGEQCLLLSKASLCAHRYATDIKFSKRHMSERRKQ